MPTYEYRCNACQHEFDYFQSMKDKVLTKCPSCKKNKLERLIGTGAAIIFKGGGFYETDYRSDAYRKAAEADKPPAPAEAAKSIGGPADKGNKSGNGNESQKPAANDKAAKETKAHSGESDKTGDGDKKSQNAQERASSHQGRGASPDRAESESRASGSPQATSPADSRRSSVRPSKASESGGTKASSSKGATASGRPQHNITTAAGTPGKVKSASVSQSSPARSGKKPATRKR